MSSADVPHGQQSFGVRTWQDMFQKLSFELDEFARPDPPIATGPGRHTGANQGAPLMVNCATLTSADVDALALAITINRNESSEGSGHPH